MNASDLIRTTEEEITHLRKMRRALIRHASLVQKALDAGASIEILHRRGALLVRGVDGEIFSGLERIFLPLRGRLHTAYTTHNPHLTFILERSKS